MPPKKSTENDLILARDILDAARTVMEYTDGKSWDDWYNNGMLRDAVIRQLIVMGEAANGFTTEFVTTHASQKWQKIADLRHRIVHGYSTIDISVIWDIVHTEVQRIIVYLDPLVGSDD